MKFIKKFEDYTRVNEDIFRVDNKVKKHEKLVIDSVIAYMKNKLDFEAKITVKKKSSISLIGDIVLNNNSVVHNKFTLHFNPNQSPKFMIKTLIHELTHIKQVSKKELQPGADYKSLIWMGEDFITVKEYIKAMKNFEIYSNLPWEKEAYNNMDSMINDYFNSSYWKDLKGKDDTIDYMMDNLEFI